MIFKLFVVDFYLENPRWRIRDRFSVRTPEQYYPRKGYQTISPHTRSLPLLFFLGARPEKGLKFFPFKKNLYLKI